RELAPVLGLGPEGRLQFGFAAGGVPTHGRADRAGDRLAGTGFARGVANFDPDARGALHDVRVDLGVLDPDGAGRGEVELPHDAVPPGAAGAGNAVSVGPVREDHAVIDAHAQAALPGCKRAQIVDVWRHQRAARPDLLSI